MTAGLDHLAEAEDAGLTTVHWPEVELCIVDGQPEGSSSGSEEPGFHGGRIR